MDGLPPIPRDSNDKGMAAMLDAPTEEATLFGHLLLISSIMAAMTSHEKKTNKQKNTYTRFLKKIQIQLFGPTVKRVGRPTSFRVHARGDYVRASH